MSCPAALCPAPIGQLPRDASKRRLFLYPFQGPGALDARRAIKPKFGMYRIIGADGKEYGPVPADQLRQWIAEGRANANSRVSLEGTAEWRTLGSFPEFAYLLSTVRLPAVFSPVPAQTNHPLATASMVMGILSLVFCFCCYGIPFNVLGLVFAITALFQIGADPQRYTGKGMALTGLILSLLSIILCLVFFVIMGLSSAWNTGPHHHKL